MMRALGRVVKLGMWHLMVNLRMAHNTVKWCFPPGWYRPGNQVRWYKTRKADKAGRIPGWWDITVDCAYSDKWYRCGNCDTCLHYRNRPNWETADNWGN